MFVSVKFSDFGDHHCGFRTQKDCILEFLVKPKNQEHRTRLLRGGVSTRKELVTGAIPGNSNLMWKILNGYERIKPHKVEADPRCFLGC